MKKWRGLASKMVVYYGLTMKNDGLLWYNNHLIWILIIWLGFSHSFSHRCPLWDDVMWCIGISWEYHVGYISVWWFGTLELFFPSYWEFDYPNWRSPSFFRGVGIPPSRYESWWFTLGATAPSASVSMAVKATPAESDDPSKFGWSPRGKPVFPVALYRVNVQGTYLYIEDMQDHMI